MANSPDFYAHVDYKQWARQFTKLKNEDIPACAAYSLNATADAVTKAQIKTAKRIFTVRTQYTLNSMKSGRAAPFLALNKALGKNIDRMFSAAGSFSPYLWMHDPARGSFIQRGKDGPIPIATLRTRTSKSAQKAIRKVYRLSGSDKFTPGGFGQNSSGTMFVGRPKGGGRRYGVYQRTNNNKRLYMLRNLETSEAKIKDTNFHDNAVKKYGTWQFTRAQFIRHAQKMEAKYGNG